MEEMLRVIEPAVILVYGGEVKYDYQGIKTVFYDNHVTENLKKLHELLKVNNNRAILNKKGVGFYVT